jgi:hypothetical protein
MPTQSRVPGAASSEVDFELERFERTAEDRIEVSGRWYGLRGRRFVRPVLNLNASGSRRRAIALLEHKPWAANDGQTWLAAFRWPEGAGEVDSAELELGPGLVVELPAPGGKSEAVARVRLRPQLAAVAPPWRAGDEHEDGQAAPDWTAAPPRSVVDAARAERDEAIAGRDDAERQRVAALSDRDDALSRRDAALRDVDRAAAERDEAVAERERLRAELERVTRERDIAHAERNRTLQSAEAVTRERDQAAAERDAARSELARALPARDEAIRERDAEAARADQAVTERDLAAAERKSAVAQRDRARRERDRAMRAAGVEPPEESPYLSPVPIRAAPRRVAATEPGAGNVSAGGSVRRLPGGRAGSGGVVQRAAGDASGGETQSMPAQASSGETETIAGEASGGEAESIPGEGSAEIRARREPSAKSPAGLQPVADPAPGDHPAATDAAGPASSRDRATERADHDGAATPPPNPAARSGRAGTAAPPGTPLPSRPIKKIGTGPLGPALEPKPLLTPVDAGRPRRLSRTRRAPSASARWAVRITVLLLMLAITVVLVMLVGRAL